MQDANPTIQYWNCANCVFLQRSNPTILCWNCVNCVFLFRRRCKDSMPVHGCCSPARGFENRAICCLLDCDPMETKNKKQQPSLPTSLEHVFCVHLRIMPVSDGMALDHDTRNWIPSSRGKGTNSRVLWTANLNNGWYLSTRGEKTEGEGKEKGGEKEAEQEVISKFQRFT